MLDRFSMLYSAAVLTDLLFRLRIAVAGAVIFILH